MKRLLLLAIFSFATFAIHAQEISEEQWALVSKKTADWCPFCGQWGWTIKNNILEDQAEKPVVFWMMHHSGGLMTPTSKAISDNFPAGGQPIFFVNNDNMGVGSSNINAKRTEIDNYIDGLLSFPPLAGVGSTATFDGEKITSTAKVNFMIAVEGGEYWLASYLVDDELIAFQSSQGNNAVHENILLHSFNGDNYFGENVLSGAASAGDEFIVAGELDFSGQTNIPDYSVGYSVVTVLWSKVGNAFTPFNLNRQPVVASTVSTKDILENVDVRAFHMGAGQINLNITSDLTINNASLQIFDMNGRTVAAQNSVQINAGENQIMMEAQELAIGTYVVVIESEVGSRSVKISVQ